MIAGGGTAGQGTLVTILAEDTSESTYAKACDSRILGMVWIHTVENDDGQVVRI